MHYSVLLNESVELLNIKPSGVYVDGTFGRGGHTKAILNKLSGLGRLIGFDKDLEAVEYARHNIEDQRFCVVHGSFAGLDQYLKANGVQKIDGLLLDLGVSSPQLDTKERGFSFRFDAELDMRMNTTAGVDLGTWINSASEKEIAEVLDKYGQERFYRRIARGIVNSRKTKPIVTTFELVDILDKNIPFKERDKHFATRSFQAFRIFINNELSDLEAVLEDIPNFLAVAGRVVVISFHSLEDRIVKNRFNQLSRVSDVPKWVIPSQNDEPSFRVIAKKVKASDFELKENLRSRSAIMRSLERLK